MHFTTDNIISLYALIGVFLFSAIFANINQIVDAVERLR